MVGWMVNSGRDGLKDGNGTSWKVSGLRIGGGARLDWN